MSGVQVGGLSHMNAPVGEPPTLGGKHPARRAVFRQTYEMRTLSALRDSEEMELNELSQIGFLS